MSAPTQSIAQPFAEFLKTWWYMPMTIWRETFESFYHPQLFLGCNIQDMDDEYNVLNEVGSYGKQLSEIQKILDVLVAHLPAEDELSAKEKLALDSYKAYTARVSAALADTRGPRPAELSAGYVERLADALRAKRLTDKDEYERLLAQLRLTVDDLAKQG